MCRKDLVYENVFNPTNGLLLNKSNILIKVFVENEPNVDMERLNVVMERSNADTGMLNVYTERPNVIMERLNVIMERLNVVMERPNVIMERLNVVMEWLNVIIENKYYKNIKLQSYEYKKIYR
jgi:hypothetical protein